MVILFLLEPIITLKATEFLLKPIFLLQSIKYLSFDSIDLNQTLSSGRNSKFLGINYLQSYEKKAKGLRTGRSCIQFSLGSEKHCETPRESRMNLLTGTEALEVHGSSTLTQIVVLFT